MPFFQYFLDCVDGHFDFFVGVVEVRRKTDPRFRAIVDEDVALEQGAADFRSVGHVDGDGAASLFGIARGIHAPAVLVGEFDQLGGLPPGFCADAVDAYFINNPHPGTRGFERWDVQRPVHEAVLRIGVANRAWRLLAELVVRAGGDPIVGMIEAAFLRAVGAE